MRKKNHRTDHRSLKRIALFVFLTIFSVITFVIGMIQNGKGAVARYDTLVAVDKAGGDVAGALNDLRSYIYAHMNTEIGGPNGIYPPIQLSGTYQRLVDAENKRVQEANDELYSEAQLFCEANGPQTFSGRGRLDCINQYVDERGAKPKPIDDSFYKYDFVAPRWSPDLAGFSAVAFCVFLFLLLYNLFIFIRTRHIVRLAN